MSTKTMTKPDNEASPAMYADRNKKWMPIIIEAVKEMPTLLCLEPVTSQARMVSSGCSATQEYGIGKTVML